MMPKSLDSAKNTLLGTLAIHLPTYLTITYRALTTYLWMDGHAPPSLALTSYGATVFQPARQHSRTDLESHLLKYAWTLLAERQKLI